MKGSFYQTGLICWQAKELLKKKSYEKVALTVMLGMCRNCVSIASVAQLVERHLAKVEVASSNLVTCSNLGTTRSSEKMVFFFIRSPRLTRFERRGAYASLFEPLTASQPACSKFFLRKNCVCE